jgi:signal transduction histidine kinase
VTSHLALRTVPTAPAGHLYPVAVTTRTRDLVAIAAIVSAVATAAVGIDPTVRFAFNAPEVRTALATSQGLIALVVAYLLYGRVRRRRLLNDLALVFALGLLAVASLFFAALPISDIRESSLVFQTWAPLITRAIAIAAIAWSALARDHRLPERLRNPGVTVVIAIDAVLAVVAISVAALSSVLPPGVRVTAITAGAPDLAGHTALTVTLLFMAAASGAASLGFLKRSTGRRDPLGSALAIGCVLFAFAFVCFAVYPSADTEIIQSGDALRLGFYLVLLIGAEREIDRYWSRLADVAIYEERRRLARDLHDGVAQELAYVVTQTRLLVRGRAAPGTDERVAAAAERALDESRRAIIALTVRDDEPLHLALARAAEDVAGRVGIEVDVDVQMPIDRQVSGELREALVRIVQESVSNAGRHGQATRVRITMGVEGVLRIADNGAGFDPGGAGDGRFGLVSMRERAERLGARFTIDSGPGRGTSVEVALP